MTTGWSLAVWPTNAASCCFLAAQSSKGVTVGERAYSRRTTVRLSKKDNGPETAAITERGPIQMK